MYIEWIMLLLFFSVCFIRAIRALILIVSFILLLLKFMPLKKIWHKKTVSLKAEWLREALGQAVTHHHDHAGTVLIKRWQDLFPRVYQQGPSTNPETESFHHNVLYGCVNASLHSNAPRQAFEEALNIVRDRVRVTAETGKRRPHASKRGDEREWR